MPINFHIYKLIGLGYRSDVPTARGKGGDDGSKHRDAEVRNKVAIPAWLAKVARLDRDARHSRLDGPADRV